MELLHLTGLVVPWKTLLVKLYLPDLTLISSNENRLFYGCLLSKTARGNCLTSWLPEVLDTIWDKQNTNYKAYVKGKVGKLDVCKGL